MKETMMKNIYLINFLPNKFIIDVKKYSQKSKKALDKREKRGYNRKAVRRRRWVGRASVFENWTTEFRALKGAKESVENKSLLLLKRK